MTGLQFSSLSDKQILAMLPFTVLTVNEKVFTITTYHLKKLNNGFYTKDVKAVYNIKGQVPLTTAKQKVVTALEETQAIERNALAEKHKLALNELLAKITMQSPELTVRVTPSTVQDVPFDAYLQPSVDGIKVKVFGVTKDRTRINYQRYDTDAFGTTTEVFM
jgi:hypothetical protein